MKSVEFRFEWKKFLLFALITYAVVLGIRLLQPTPLPDSVTMVDGEHLLSTHDAYNWLIRAIDPKTFAPHPFSSMTNLFVSVTGCTYETVAYWAPPLLASLVGVAMLGWLAVLGCLELGIAAACLAALCPGFVYRTLLGFYDTDLVVLLFPLLLTLAPAILLRYRIYTCGQAFAAWRGKLTDGAVVLNESAPSPALLSLLFVSGVLGGHLQEMHEFFFYLAKLIPLICLGLVLILGASGKKLPLLAAIAVYALPMEGGWIGFAVGLLLFGAFLFPAAFGNRIFLHKYAWLLMVVAIAFLGLDGALIDSIIYRVTVYLKPVDSAADGLLVTFPSVIQSVIEAQNLSLGSVLQYLYPYVSVAFVGCVGFLISLWFAPLLAFLLPMFALGILSFKLGGRMTMFAGPGVSIGLILPVHYLLMYFFETQYGKQAVRLGIAAVLTIVLILPVWGQMSYLPVVPFISSAQVKALKAAEKEMSPDATVWTWWDWGYATQFFTRKWTYTDGARHNSDTLYPMAAVYTTDSPRFANQLIKYIDANSGNLFVAWKGKSQQEILQTLDDFRMKDMGLSLSKKQYLVVTMDSLKLGSWITSFGSWDFAEKKMKGYNVTKMGQISLNDQVGAFAETSGSLKTPIPVETIDILTENGVDHKEYYRFNGVHLVIDTISDTRFIMDSSMYNSMMVRLLIVDPQDVGISRYFKLVYGNVHTRIYEVL